MKKTTNTRTHLPLTCGHPDCNEQAKTTTQADGGTPWPIPGKGWTYKPGAGYRCPAHQLPDSLRWIMAP